MWRTILLNPRRVPFLLLLAALFGALCSFAVMKNAERSAEVLPPSPTPVNAPPACEVKVFRMKGYTYTQPLLYAERRCPSTRLEKIHQGVDRLVARYEGSGQLFSASFYLRDLARGDWTASNDTAEYWPGSLLKVPTLMTFLLMAEKDDGLMHREYRYDAPSFAMPAPIYPPKESIVPGRSYTVKDLLERMIRYSDNSATLVLNQHMDMDIYLKVFTDLGLPPHGRDGKRVPMTVQEFSVFMKTLYNSSYLSAKDSEYALGLLTTSDFSHGLRSGVPGTVQLAHKFGESSDTEGMELHESGIVYLHDEPYLLTIMTRGPETTKLSEIIAAISGNVFQGMEQL